MKQYRTIFATGMALLCLLSAFGCGRAEETTRSTVKATTVPTTQYSTTNSTATDPMRIPTPQTPITGPEQNVPESGIGGNGSEGVIDPFDDSGSMDTTSKNHKKQRTPLPEINR